MCSAMKSCLLSLGSLLLFLSLVQVGESRVFHPEVCLQQDIDNLSPWMFRLCEKLLELYIQSMGEELNEGMLAKTGTDKRSADKDHVFLRFGRSRY
eukprot:TRINITY_DN11381_c0_g1_i1.p1 TRINITY_DN11381_c0_g1~~TRINITY_DN11381_c0_g1_i1.p1  ORF type:complete len:108 (-),score=3.88 TRINITY_DN11381_c0_g1_i1:143-430(-)